VLAIIAMVSASPFAMRGASASKAPEFSLPTAEGTTYASTAHKGRRIVISFYKSYY
jgi:peroxiredoxin